MSTEKLSQSQERPQFSDWLYKNLTTIMESYDQKAVIEIYEKAPGDTDICAGYEQPVLRTEPVEILLAARLFWCIYFHSVGVRSFDGKPYIVFKLTIPSKEDPLDGVFEK